MNQYGNQVQDPDADERRQAFNKWLRRRGAKLQFYALPAQHTGCVHEMLKQAYLAGARFERRQQEPVQIGGDQVARAGRPFHPTTFSEDWVNQGHAEIVAQITAAGSE